MKVFNVYVRLTLVALTQLYHKVSLSNHSADCMSWKTSSVLHKLLFVDRHFLLLQIRGI
jgi:hypothetical protein